MDSQCNSNSPLDIEDIEDLFDQAPPESLSKTSVNSKLVVPKVKKRTKKGIRIEEIETKFQTHVVVKISFQLLAKKENLSRVAGSEAEEYCGSSNQSEGF